MALYIGLMSGTSLDGVDGVLAAFDEPGAPPGGWLRAHVHEPYPPALRAALLALCEPGPDDLHAAALAANALARVYAAVTQRLLDAAGVAAAAVRAVGAHGQTVRHRPGALDGEGYTLQLLNAALVAERTGIDIVSDLRSRDVASGGQGAPLVPAYHAAAFGGDAGRPRAVLNLGGIANLTSWDAAGAIQGFDCGPGNMLLDAWCARHGHGAFDGAGAWAASGQVDTALLATLMAHPYFALPPPKSTGRELFGIESVLATLQDAPRRAQDVQATLAQWSVEAAAQAVEQHAAASADLLVCGGGALNADLMARLAARLPTRLVRSTAALGVEPTHVEALAFAWLARCFVLGQPGNRPEVTGAAGLRRLGSLTPGR